MRHSYTDHAFKRRRLDFGLKYFCYTEDMEGADTCHYVDDSRHGHEVDGFDEENDDGNTPDNV